MSVEPWIGVDLDGTLAKYDRWRGVDHIGEPVPAMVERVKSWLAHGHKVKIFTARVSERQSFEAAQHIKRWCEEHIGQPLEVTNVKDFGMIALWDDRAVRVKVNEGEPCCDYQ